MSGELAGELVELVVELVRRRGHDGAREDLEGLLAKWPAPIAANDVNAAIAAGLDRTRSAGGAR